MQRELAQRAKEHREKSLESAAAGRRVQAHKYAVMAERTERLRDEALLDELNSFEEKR